MFARRGTKVVTGTVLSVVVAGGVVYGTVQSEAVAPGAGAERSLSVAEMDRSQRFLEELGHIVTLSPEEVGERYGPMRTSTSMEFHEAYERAVRSLPTGEQWAGEASADSATAAAVAAYVDEHERLVQAALGDEVWGGQPPLNVASTTGEGYVGEHGRLVGATLGTEVPEDGGAQASSALSGETYVEEHERLLQATLGDEVWGGHPPLDVASATGESYVEEHERLLDGDGAFFPDGE